MELINPLQQTVEQLNFETISAERKDVLRPFIDYVRRKLKEKAIPRLNFICTHNSRRSQFSQIWAQTAAYYYGIDAKCYSGGVEVTAFNARAVESIQRMGFQVSVGEGENPQVLVRFAEDAEPVIAFSKLFDHDKTLASGFAAIMTCSHADENCPYIPGAEVRLPVRYNDPKEYDDSPLEKTMYDKRSLEIATEMFYVFSKVK